MSNFRTRAKEIKAAGEAERGNFEPTGAPKRIYNYWLNESLSDYAENILKGTKKENFCHFWRVVAIWAPLHWLGNKAEPLVAKAATWKILLSLAVVSIVILGFVFETFGLIILSTIAAVLSVSVATFAIMCGISLGLKNDVVRSQSGLFEKDIAKWGLIIFPITVPVYIFSKLWYSGYQKASFIGAVVTLLIAMSVFSLARGEFLDMLYGFGGALLIIAAAFTIVVAVFFAVSSLIDYISGNRAVKMQEAKEARWKYFDENGEFPLPAVKEPGRMSKFFTGIGDFLIFIGQIIRVNKWKVCPVVSIDTKTEV